MKQRAIKSGDKYLAFNPSPELVKVWEKHQRDIEWEKNMRLQKIREQKEYDEFVHETNLKIAETNRRIRSISEKYENFK